MTISELLSTSEALVADQWQKLRPPGDAKAYRLLKEAGFFIWRTGQLYRFEEYLARPSADRVVDVLSHPLIFSKGGSKRFIV